MASSPSARVSASAGSLVGAAERSRYPPVKIPRKAAAIAKHRAEIAKSLRTPCGCRSEVIAGNGNGKIRPQAQFLAGLAGGQEHAAANILPRQVEERLGRLQNHRMRPRTAGAFVSRTRLCAETRVSACVSGRALVIDWDMAAAALAQAI